jgi:hypothetical protein
MRRVGIELRIRVRVVAPMVSHPTDEWSFERHRAGHREHRAYGARRPKAPVGEQPVEPDRDPVSGHGVHDHCEHKVTSVDVVAQHADRREYERHHRQEDNRRRHRLCGSVVCGAISGGLGIKRARKRSVGWRAQHQ